MLKKLAFLLLALCLCLPTFAERIVVVGDSITGHSMNLPCGFTHEVRKALAEAGVTDVEFIPYGGSGQTMQSWQNVVRESETQSRQLDIPGILVKDEMDKGADTVLIMLGMNDVLCPLVTDGPDRWEIWKGHCQTLIDMLRARFEFKKLIIGAPTMLTESPFSFKNLQMDQMERCIREVAAKNGAQVLEVRSDFKRFHENARKENVTYRMINDYVHPGAEGHNSMTWSILNAIGQPRAAQLYLEKHCPDFMKDFSRPGMSLYVVSPTEPELVCVAGHLRGATRDQLRVEAPEGLTLDRIETFDADGFRIFLKGHNESLTSEIRVTAGDITRTVRLNAPYRVAYGFHAAPFHNAETFQSATAATQVDADVLAGKSPFETRIDGQPLTWLTYYPSVDLTGGDDPNNVDFCALDNASAFATAYAVREVFSPVAQPAKLFFNVNSFSTNEAVVVYLNGQPVFEKFFVRGQEKTAQGDVQLNAGWNTLVIRTTHTTWQWVLSTRIAAPDGSELDLRYR